MSKYFDETVKAQQQKPRAGEPGPVDVVSLLDTIKQTDPAIPISVKEPHPVARKIPLSKVPNTLAAILQDSEPYLAAFKEAYQSLRTRVMRIRASGVHSMMLTSSLMLEGKTLTALNLALVCSQLNDQSVLLVDGDLRSRGLTTLVQIEAEIGLSDVLSGTTTAPESVLSTDQRNLKILGAGTSCQQTTSDLFASSNWKGFMAWAKERFSIVLIDAPPIHKVADAELMSASCDGTLFVIRAHSTPRELALSCAARLDKKKIVGLILNGVQEGEGVSYGYYGVVPYGTPPKNKVT
jgi:capsular exopolysaccharide synthesis family protein